MRSNKRKVMKSIPQIDQQGFVPRDTLEGTSDSYNKAQAKLSMSAKSLTVSTLSNTGKVGEY